jgi:tungstate transport system substrate-binding protein
MSHRQLLLSWILIYLATSVGCEWSPEQDNKLVLATTTSARDSGLLDAILPGFENTTGIEVEVIAVGTGQALKLGRRGDADILLTHAPAAENKFIADGYADQRHIIMSNDFLLAGPESDPASIKNTPHIGEAMQKIVEKEMPFISRGDESGTHLREQQAWRDCGISPEGAWYIEAGSGMAATLRMASEIQAHTLCDRGTFLAQQDNLKLAILCQHDPNMKNEYAAMIISQAKHPHVNFKAAQQFVDFLTAPDIQEVIGQFGITQYGTPLFVPAGHDRPAEHRLP